MQPIIPDGRIELIFHFGSRFVQHIGADSVLQPYTLASGQSVTPVVLSPTGEVATFGVRLRPAASAAVLGDAAHQLTGRIVDAEDVLGHNVVALSARVAEA